MGMSKVWGKIIHRAEQLEMDFLRKMGVDTLFIYPEVENHLETLSDIILEGECVQDEEENELYVLELEEKVNDMSEGINEAYHVLQRMRKYLKSENKKSILFGLDDGLKETLLSCIDEVEEDLAE